MKCSNCPDELVDMLMRRFKRSGSKRKSLTVLYVPQFLTRQKQSRPQHDCPDAEPA